MVVWGPYRTRHDGAPAGWYGTTVEHHAVLAWRRGGLFLLRYSTLYVPATRDKRWWRTRCVLPYLKHAGAHHAALARANMPAEAFFSGAHLVVDRYAMGGGDVLYMPTRALRAAPLCMRYRRNSVMTLMSLNDGHRRRLTVFLSPLYLFAAPSYIQQLFIVRRLCLPFTQARGSPIHTLLYRKLFCEALPRHCADA